MGRKLAERIGHYCRTELKTRYETIIAIPDHRCRYMIPCPIREFSNRVYIMAKTDVELTCEELIPSLEAKAGGYITYHELMALLKDMGIVTNYANVKQYLTVLQHKKVLSFEEERTKARRLGFEILVKTNDPFSEEDPEWPMIDENLYNERLVG